MVMSTTVAGNTRAQTYRIEQARIVQHLGDVDDTGVSREHRQQALNQAKKHAKRVQDWMHSEYNIDPKYTQVPGVTLLIMARKTKKGMTYTPMVAVQVVRCGKNFTRRYVINSTTTLKKAWNKITFELAKYDGYAKRPSAWEKALPDPEQFYDLVCWMEEDGHEIPEDTLDPVMTGTCVY